jgi:hypothetical protein
MSAADGRVARAGLHVGLRLPLLCCGGVGRAAPARKRICRCITQWRLHSTSPTVHVHRHLCAASPAVRVHRQCCAARLAVYDLRGSW